jgi:hypothetical protein
MILVRLKGVFGRVPIEKGVVSLFSQKSASVKGELISQLASR